MDLYVYTRPLTELQHPGEMQRFNERMQHSPPSAARKGHSQQPISLVTSATAILAAKKKTSQCILPAIHLIRPLDQEIRLRPGNRILCAEAGDLADSTATPQRRRLR